MKGLRILQFWLITSISRKSRIVVLLAPPPIAKQIGPYYQRVFKQAVLGRVGDLLNEGPTALRSATRSKGDPQLAPTTMLLI
jgi:hypothetical protein